MKTITVQQVKKLLECSESTAMSIVYSDVLATAKLYTNRGNNAKVTINFFAKHGIPVIDAGNDAPRGGKYGDFVVFKKNYAFAGLQITVSDEDNRLFALVEKAKAEKAEALEKLTFTPEEIAKIKTKIQNANSNRHVKGILNNESAKKLGFYSTEGMSKLQSLVNA